MPSGRQMVDTRVAVPNEESRCPLLIVLSIKSLDVRALEGRRSCSLFTTQGDELTQNRYHNCTATVCLPSVIITCDQISQAFLCRINILQATKYWRWEWTAWNKVTIRAKLLLFVCTAATMNTIIIVLE